MADVFSKKKRSQIMSHIKGKETSLEKIVFTFLNKKGIYYKKHYLKALGKPDIALPRKKVAVFIDGDFWHGYGYNKNKTRLPKIYWQRKIENNIKRDKRNRVLLKKQGWRVLRIWEHQIKKNPEKYLNKVRLFLGNN